MLMRKLRKSTVAVAFGISLLFPFAVKAEGADGYSESEVTYHFYEQDVTGKMKAVFKDGMPSIPYVDTAEYLNKIMNVSFIESVEDGKIVVSGEAGSFTVDTEKEQIEIADYNEISSEKYAYVAGSELDAPYMKEGEKKTVEKGESKTIDFTKYNIDLLNVDGKAYVPLATLSDLFGANYNCAEYVDGEIYFVHTMDNYAKGIQTDSYVDRTSLYDTETRSQDVVDFTYNELCFVFDELCGKPTQCVLTDSIRKNGLDKTLENYDEGTKRVKELLHSDKTSDFIRGMVALQGYAYDGGHTSTGIEVLSEIPIAYKDSKVAMAFEGADISKLINDGDQDFINALVSGSMKQRLGGQYSATRAAVFAEAGYELVMGGEEEWDADTTFYRHGDTGVFTFNSFNQKVVPWLKAALDYSEKNGINNFIVDLTSNGGGDSSVMCYMIAIMSNRNKDTNTSYCSLRDEVSGDIVRTTYLLDSNLDGKYDDEDKKVSYDLNYAFLTSPYAFSCGNLTPFIAKDAGIMIMGARTGGGACSIMKCYTPDGHFYFVSSNRYFVVNSGLDVDLGVPVDVNLMQTDGEGEEDITGFYDIDQLGNYMNAFYAGDIVAKKIDEIKDASEVTTADKTEIEALKAAFDALTEEQKAKVSTAKQKKLNAAVAVLKAKEAQEAAEASRKEAETAKEKALTEKKAAEKAKAEAEAARKAAEAKAAKAKAAALKAIAKGELAKVKGGKGKISVKWKALKGVQAYRVLISKNKKGTIGAKVYNINSTKKLSTVLKKLKKGTYYVRVRGFRYYKGNSVCGKYSLAKVVKVK